MERVAVVPPRVRSAPRVRRSGRALEAVRVGVIWSAAAFVAFCASYIGTGITAQVMFERSRQAAISALERTQASDRAEGALRTRVEALSSPNSSIKWAADHGFVLPVSGGPSAPAVATERTYVASNN